MASLEVVTECKYTLSGTLKQREGSFSSNCEQLPLNFFLKSSSTKKHKKTSKRLATHCSLIVAPGLVCLFWKCTSTVRTADKSKKDASPLDEGEETAAEREISEYMLIGS